MKACPVCGRLYPGDAGFCPEDGAQLLSATQVPIQDSAQDARIGHLMSDRYQVRRVVADGGMGRVYEALDMQERRHVALKILHPDVAQDEVAVERFKREFEVSKQLPHRHIVDVLDFHPTHDGSFALVMEFLYGEELRATLKREQTVPPERIVRMLSQVALALDEAHKRSFVHRDLKPDNVFLCQTSDGDIVKILDFGSVKDKASTAKKLTVIGTTIGSPYYMAPEQAQGLETLDHRADVWALAAITYECATGAVPFSGHSGPSILLEILTKEPNPPSVAGKGAKHPVPPTLDRALAHAFQKQASARTASAGDFADAVGAAYGLAGTHREWAITPQTMLAGQIQARMPELMTAPVARSVGDDFFGAGGGLDVIQDPFGGSIGAQVAPVPSPGPVVGSRPEGAPPPTNDEPLVVPTQSIVPILIAVVIGLGALGVGILVAWLLMG